MRKTRRAAVVVTLFALIFIYQNCDSSFAPLKLDLAQVADTQGPGDNPLTKTSKKFLFLALIDTGVVETYSIDIFGKLSKVSAIDLNGSIVPLTMDPSHSHLYAGLGDKRSVVTLQINKDTGALTKKSETPIGLNPVYLAMHPLGGNLLIPSYGDNEVAVYGIDSGGDLIATERDRQPTGLNPHAALFDRSGNFAFIPNCSSDYVAQYSFDAQNGKLTANTVNAKIDSERNANPRHVAYHPKKEILYVVNERDDTVAVYKMNADGTLTSLQTLTTLPTNFNGNNNTTADIHITSDAKFVYASNRGHNSLAIYSVDVMSGLLTAVGHQAVEGVPREFDIDPSGKFIFVGGQEAKRLNSFSISPTTGLLSPIEAFDTSGNPIWLTTVEYPTP